jgi:hypothetical protein
LSSQVQTPTLTGRKFGAYDDFTDSKLLKAHGTYLTSPLLLEGFELHQKVKTEIRIGRKSCDKMGRYDDSTASL